jgi:hypothetical protein
MFRKKSDVSLSHIHRNSPVTHINSLIFCYNAYEEDIEGKNADQEERGKNLSLNKEIPCSILS